MIKHLLHYLETSFFQMKYHLKERNGPLFFTAKVQFFPQTMTKLSKSYLKFLQ